MDQNLQKHIKIIDRLKKWIGLFLVEIFEFGQITQNQGLEIEIRGNQKLLIPYDKGWTRWLARSSRIRGGFVRGKGKNTKNAMNTHKPDTIAHQHDSYLFLPRARIQPPNSINKRKTLG